LFYQLIYYNNRTRASNNSTKNHFSEIFIKYLGRIKPRRDVEILPSAVQCPGQRPSACAVRRTFSFAGCFAAISRATLERATDR
jgi:hypothetical protein